MKVLLALVALSLSGWAAELRPFSPGLWRPLVSEDRIVLIEFYSSGSPVCARQRSALEHVAQDPPGWEPVLLRADFEKDLELRRRYQVSAASTLLLLRGDAELGRAVGLENEENIRDFILGAESRARGVPAPRPARPFRPRP